MRYSNKAQASANPIQNAVLDNVAGRLPEKEAAQMVSLNEKEQYARDRATD